MQSTFKMIKSKKGTWLNILIALGVSVFPLIPLFIYKFFYVDWLNNLWVIQYYARFFKANNEMPFVINTSNILVGMTNPLYYGYLYYQTMGIIAIIVGNARRAVILILLLLSFFMYLLYFKLFRKILNTTYSSESSSFIDTLCFIIPAIMLWSTYLITKIYDDGARTETNAILLLYILVGLWIHVLLADDGSKRIAIISCFSFILFVFIGTHPITTEIGGTLLFIFVVCTIPTLLKTSKNRIGMLVFGGTLLTLVLLAISPWFYITITNAITTNLGGAGTLEVNNKRWISNVVNRLMIVPFDFEAVKGGISVISPYMTLQINVPLLIMHLLLFVLVVKNKKINHASKIRSSIIMLVAAFFFACCSMDSFQELVRVVFYSIQFNFRLISYTDMFIAAGLAYDLYLIIKSGELVRHKKLIWTFLVISMTISAHNVITQWTYAYALSDNYVGDIYSSDAPDNFYWLNDYADISTKIISKEELNLPMEDVYFSLDDSNVNVATENFDNIDRCIVSTNVSVSPYNTLLLDGEPVEHEDIFRLKDTDYTCSFVVETSGSHTLSYTTVLPRAYLVLRKIALISAILLLMTALLTMLRAFMLMYRLTKLEEAK